MVRVQENLYYQEHGVISYYNDSLFTNVNTSASASVINFSTRTLDPRNLVTPGEGWLFRAPRARVYNVKILVQLTPAASEGTYFTELTEGVLVPNSSTGTEVTNPTYPYIVYSNYPAQGYPLDPFYANATTHAISPLAATGPTGTCYHTHRISDYYALLRDFTNASYTIDLRKNGSSLTSGVFKQNPSVTIYATAGAGLTGFSVGNRGSITGWLETTLPLDTNDTLDVTHAYDFSPITIYNAFAYWEFLKYNVSAKAYIFISEVSKRT